MLDQLILDELKKMDLTGISVLSVESHADVIRVVFDSGFAEIEFAVDEAYQIEILSVTDADVIHEDPEYFVQFEDVVFEVMTKVKLIEMKKRKEYDSLLLKGKKRPPVRTVAEKVRWDALLKQERNLEKQEQALVAKEEEVKILEILLRGEEHAISLERNEEAGKLEAVRLENREKLGNKIKGKIGKFRK